jgi:hypothetical protein
VREGDLAQGIPGAVYDFISVGAASDLVGFGIFYGSVTGGSVTADNDSGTWVTGTPGHQLVLRENTT